MVKILNALQNFYVHGALLFTRTYQKVYKNQHVVHVRLFDLSGLDDKAIYEITWMEHISNFFSMMVWREQTEYVIPNFHTSDRIDHHKFYEITFWNGQKELTRTTHFDFETMGTDLEAKPKKILHITLGGVEVTKFINQYISSLNKDNNITTNELYRIAIICNQIQHPVRKDTLIESKFVTCDEVIVNTKFKNSDVVHIHQKVE